MKYCDLKPCKGDIFVAGGSAPGIKRSGDPRCANVHGRREKHSRTERYRSLQEFPHSGESIIISSIKEQDTLEKETSLKRGCVKSVQKELDCKSSSALIVYNQKYMLGWICNPAFKNDFSQSLLSIFGPTGPFQLLIRITTSF
jgi:hypothetical protein